ncbi:MAG: RcpC/CpaB family pilus assembly protein [Acidimicrobiia bacterium]
MLIAGLLGAVLTLVALRAADTRVAVPVAATDLTAGTRIAATSFTVRNVRIDAALRDKLVRPQDLSALTDAVLLTPISAGAPIPRTALVTGIAGDNRRAVSLPIAPERAVGGRLRAGDRVDVYTSGQRGALISNNVEVLEVIKTDKGPLTARDTITIVLAVDSEQANKIAPIVGSQDVVLVQTTGAPTNKATPPAPSTTAASAPGAAVPATGGTGG